MREPRQHDKNHELFKDVSQLALPIDRIPQDILSRAQKVFSKHSTKDVMEWSALLMKNYQLLHAVEKPLNFDFVKPFANTSDLKNFTPHIDENLAAQKMEQRLKQGGKQTSEDQTIDVDQKPKSKFETDEVKE